MQRAERRLERAVRAFFRKQIEWIEVNWPRLLPAGATLVFAIPADEWEPWAKTLARDLQGVLGGVMVLGAEAAREELTGITVDWTLQHPEAQKWLQQHGLGLAKGLNDTTKKQLRGTLKAGLKLGDNRDQLAKRVQNVTGGMTRWRARLIAQTETIRAHAQGSHQVYKVGGATHEQWLDGQERACPICRDGLDMQIKPIDGQFEDQFGNLYDGPPAHPGCRCAVRSVDISKVPEELR